ncbi:Uncharacterized protein TCM_024200 [Theobroma cacao]|uniref:Uncharacterized protein n=1 Tax=Theobroma cacao TaxID=3641 RepID=A0A061F314_THECC|nr:Uncharacterized protein TCM_024200 [Theobroma cacao]
MKSQSKLLITRWIIPHFHGRDLIFNWICMEFSYFSCYRLVDFALCVLFGLSYSVCISLLVIGLCSFQFVGLGWFLRYLICSIIWKNFITECIMLFLLAITVDMRRAFVF